jgi:hypothetical protein
VNAKVPYQITDVHLRFIPERNPFTARGGFFQAQNQMR